MSPVLSVDPEMLRELTAELIAAYVSNNRLGREDLPQVISSVYETLASLGANVQATAPEEPEPIPAVPIRKSVTPDYLICLEDGKKFKSMRRHLSARYGMTPDDYRRKWGLPKDYPMVAASYAAKRSKLAHASGLGRKSAGDRSREA